MINDLEDTKEGLEEDKKFLADMDNICEKKEGVGRVSEDDGGGIVSIGRDDQNLERRRCLGTLQENVAQCRKLLAVAAIGEGGAAAGIGCSLGCTGSRHRSRSPPRPVGDGATRQEDGF